MTVHVGTSGWSYPDWTGVLYPPGTPAARQLSVYAQKFDTVELNGSFYHWPSDASWTRWAGLVPAGFRLSVKAPRGLTHARRLRDPQPWLERIDRAWTLLGPVAGVLLVQLPVSLERDDDVLGGFLRAMPSGVRTAVELRHPSWQVEAVDDLLRGLGVAAVVMHGGGLPCVPRVTASFGYVRFHGPDPRQMYVGSYPEADLAAWRDRIRAWSDGGVDVYAYFNNDTGGAAVHDAFALSQLLAVGTPG